MAVGKPEGKVATESVTEFIYATEYEPGELPTIITLDHAAPTDKSKLPDYATGPCPSAWDTRNLGPTFEMEATIDGATDLVNLTLTAEIVHHCGNTVWCEWRDRRSHVPIQMPVFYTLRSKTEVLTAPNQYLMAAVLSPRDTKGFTDPTRKVMVFVKAEIVCLPCGLAQEPDAEPPPPPMIQTQVEFIEVTQERHTALLAGNHTTSNDSVLRQRPGTRAIWDRPSSWNRLSMKTPARWTFGSWRKWSATSKTGFGSSGTASTAPPTCRCPFFTP